MEPTSTDATLEDNRLVGNGDNPAAIPVTFSASCQIFADFLAGIEHGDPAAVTLFPRPQQVADPACHPLVSSTRDALIAELTAANLVLSGGIELMQVTPPSSVEFGALLEKVVDAKRKFVDRNIAAANLVPQLEVPSTSTVGKIPVVINFSRPGFPLPVSIDGGNSTRVIDLVSRVDSGAERTLISGTQAREMHLAPFKTIPVQNVDGDVTERPVVHIRVNFGKGVIVPEEAIVHDSLEQNVGGYKMLLGEPAIDKALKQGIVVLRPKK